MLPLSRFPNIDKSVINFIDRYPALTFTYYEKISTSELVIVVEHIPTGFRLQNIFVDKDREGGESSFFMRERIGHLVAGMKEALVTTPIPRTDYYRNTKFDPLEMLNRDYKYFDRVESKKQKDSNQNLTEEDKNNIEDLGIF